MASEQILDEINQLESELEAQAKSAQTQKPDLRAVNGSAMEETLGELKEETPIGSGLLGGEVNMDHEEEVEEYSFDEGDEQGGAHEGALTLMLTGKMKLKLKYDFQGQEVTIGFSDECLKVELSDGTEFKIPVHKKALKSVA